MNSFKNLLSIDIETLDTAPTAKVLAIGIAIANIAERKVVSSTEFVLDTSDIYQHGRTQSAETMDWWLESPARKSLINKYRQQHGYTVASVAVRIAGFIDTFKVDAILVKSNSFDLPILDSLFSKNNPLKAISFRNVMDIRTISLVSSKADLLRPSTCTVHSAIEDAKYQALNYLHHTAP
jgi:hypothetical protein